MGMAGDTTSKASSIICPSCSEEYDSPDRVAEILRNSGFCVNLTCLHDLSREPLESVLRLKDAPRRAGERRAV